MDTLTWCFLKRGKKRRTCYGASLHTTTPSIKQQQQHTFTKTHLLSVGILGHCQAGDDDVCGLCLALLCERRRATAVRVHCDVEKQGRTRRRGAGVCWALVADEGDLCVCFVCVLCMCVWLDGSPSEATNARGGGGVLCAVCVLSVIAQQRSIDRDRSESGAEE